MEKAGSVIIMLLVALVFTGVFENNKESSGDPNEGSNPKSRGSTTADAKDCITSKETVTVSLDPAKYPESVDHIKDAISAGAPSLLHIDRDGADENRDQSLKDIPTKTGFDRDEYPLAMTKEGGEGASIRYMTPADNRGSGSSIAGQLRKYCSMQAFTIFIG